MQDTRELAQRFHDFDVIDREDNRVGSVESLWVDGATNEPEFLAVKTGRLMGRTHIVPYAGAQVDEAGRRLRVPYAQDQISSAPHIDEDADLDDEQEEQVYRHYGIDRSTAPSPTGLAGGGMSGRQKAGVTEGRREDEADGAEQTIPLAEEQLRVEKRPVEAGRARLRKVVRTERVSEPVELRREQVTIERVPASGQEVPPDAFQERQIEVPVTREEPVVQKEAHVTGEVQVGKSVETEQRTVQGEVRREDVAVDHEGDVDVRRSGQERR